MKVRHVHKLKKMSTFALMYGYQSLQDYIFLMLYGGVAMFTFAVGIYLWLRRANAIAPAITPPYALRLWTAAFFIMAALSHVWWYVFGVHWLTDDRLIRNIITITLDRITLVPLMMAVLLSELQDRRHRLWPWVLAHVPIVVMAVVGIAKHEPFYLYELVDYWQIAVIFVFIVYYIYVLLKYNRWLLENYADLEHKEVWQSMLLVTVLSVVYEIYTTNVGELAKEYLAQFATLLIVGFLLWRVETLQQLDPIDEEKEEEPKGIDIGTLLKQNCEDKQYYLQHDLTLQQLATIIGTNRTYLSAYFAQQGITYNSYINRLRIEHFMRLHRKNREILQTATAATLAQRCGFHSYSTFSAAFKNYTGSTVTAWMKAEESR